MTPLASRIAKVVVAAAGLTLLLSACMSPDQTSAYGLLNQDRTAHRLHPLYENPMLDAKAQAWAEHLASINTLVHSTLTDGISGCWRVLGENVGYGGNIPDVETAYMHSTKHRDNILGSRYDQVGTGVAWRGSRVFTVQVFMSSC